MKLLFVIAMLSLINAEAQYKFKIKEHIAPASLIILSGFCEGIQDGLAFHNKSNNPFWGQESWRNKYRNRDPLQPKTFRGKYLIFTTDGFHLAKFGNHLFTMGAITLHLTNGKRKWYVYVLEGLSYWALNRIAFNLTYNSF